VKSVILSQTTRLLTPLFIILSLLVLYRGHNLPGGGFIGGLICASGFALLAISEGVQRAESAMKLSPAVWISGGLLLAILSGFFAFFAGGPFMEAAWLPGFSLPLLGKVHLGTPILFDIGVYLTVVGFSLKVIFSLIRMEEE
jgi:multicomponent Na+:H+ antiporter subunit B